MFLILWKAALGEYEDRVGELLLYFFEKGAIRWSEDGEAEGEGEGEEEPAE